MAPSESKSKLAQFRIKRESDTWFQHVSLDLSQKSIRLLEVLPHLSKNKGIQCRLRHATTGAKYQYLSYRWGSTDGTQPSYLIEINGALSAVLSNLWSFLEAFRSSLSKTRSSLPLWIDALCIHQTS